MTPLHIDLLLHCHTTPDRYPRLGAPAVDQYLLELEADGLIEMRQDGIWRTTARGMAHVSQLCNLPFPTLQWISADGSLIQS